MTCAKRLTSGCTRRSRAARGCSLTAALARRAWTAGDRVMNKWGMTDDALSFAAAGEHGFSSPEQAALAGWPATAHARVLRVERLSASRVDVIVDTEPSHRMRVYCVKENGLWFVHGDISD